MTTKQLTASQQSILSQCFALPDFAAPYSRGEIMTPMPDVDHYHRDWGRLGARQSSTPGWLRACVEAPPLTPEQERHCFRLLNYQRWCGQQALAAGRNYSAALWADQAIEQRNFIASASFRMAIARAKTWLKRNPQLQEELASEAYYRVLLTVEAYDWRRQTRFSTLLYVNVGWQMSSYFARNVGGVLDHATGQDPDYEIEHVSPHASPGEIAERREVVDQVRRAVAGLEGRRQQLAQDLIAGIAARDTAAAFGVSRARVYSLRDALYEELQAVLLND